MATTLADLLKPLTTSDAVTKLLGYFATLKLPTTDWSSTGAERGLLQIFGQALSDYVGTKLVEIAQGGLLDLAPLAWLQLLAPSAYQNTPNPAVFARIRVRLTNSLGTPYTITPGMLWVAQSANLAARYNSANLTNQTLPGSGTLDLDFLAEFAGATVVTPDGFTANYNISGTPAIVITTPLPGVTATLLDLGGGHPMVVTGTDAEGLVPLRERCRSKWGTLAFAGPAAAYLAWAREADASITKVWVRDDNPSGPGTATVYLAGDAGAVGAAAVTAANNLIQARKPPTAAITVSSAANASVSIAATVYCKAALVDAAKTKLATLLSDYQKALQIANTTNPDAIVYRAQLFEILMTPDGVTNCTIATPATDTTPAAGQIAQLSYTITGGGPSITFTPV